MQAIETIEYAPESDTIIINPRKRSPSWGSHSPPPPATASLHGGKNPLSNCGDVRAIYGECVSTHSSDSICKTAASYFSICMRSSGPE